jgi:hypothetical protein
MFFPRCMYPNCNSPQKWRALFFVVMTYSLCSGPCPDRAHVRERPPRTLDRDQAGRAIVRRIQMRCIQMRCIQIMGPEANLRFVRKALDSFTTLRETFEKFSA